MKILGIKVEVKGALPKNGPYVMIANHFGFVEILAMLKMQGVRFVAKSELGGYPFIGWAMHRTGQIFICRMRGKVMQHLRGVQEALMSEDNIAIFPESTTGDTRTLLPFKSTLLRIVEDKHKPCDFSIVPMAISFINLTDAQKECAEWGDKSIGKYLLNTCRMSGATICVDIAHEIVVNEKGLCAKTVTADLEYIISKRFYNIIDEAKS